MLLTLTEVGKILGHPLFDESVVTGVSIDTRTLLPNALFVAIRGTKVDGHDYLSAAKERCAAGAIVETINTSVDLPQVCVTNTVDALGILANSVRRRQSSNVVGITGSYGKTTTKDMVAAVHGFSRSCHATVGNFNTEIGLPLTILSAPHDVDTLVLEMGMRGSGQIAELVRIAEPNIGVITSIGSAHIELLGSRDAIAAAKSELFRGLAPDATAVFLESIDHRDVVDQSSAHCSRLVVGESQSCDVIISNIRVGRLESSFTIAFKHESENVVVASPARFAATNGALAIATGLAAGITLKDCASGLATWRPSEGRMRPRTMANGAVVLSDAYNAAPEAMLAAISVVADIVSQGTGSSWAVLGEMRELGIETKQWHLAVGEAVFASGIQHLVIVGDAASDYRTGALIAGMNPDQVHFFETSEKAAAVLQVVVASSDVVLVKGSRAAGLDKIVDSLCGGTP
ncbi:MAG: UDP-N-acetylmuramoyl-tripeptide--D-alanyl-D-alanine ligase [Armatimonadota bacterium]